MKGKSESLLAFVCFKKSCLKAYQLPNYNYLPKKSFLTMYKNHFRKGLIVVAGILFLVNFWLINYDNLFSRENLGVALGGISNLFVIAAMLASIKFSKKEQEQ